MDDNMVWAAVDRRRADIADYLEALPPGEWDHDSLCEAWTVREVAAHLTLVGLPRWRLVPLFLRYPGSTNRVIRDGSKAVARGLTNELIVAAIRDMIGLHRPFPGLTCREALIDVVGHTQDMTLPLGREVPIPPVEIAEAADRVVSYGGRGSAKVFRALPTGGLRLVADDHDWTTGEGEPVTGSMRDLFLLLTGRTVHLDRLAGAGADRLREQAAARR
ncbi:maleylpyruvate isomerase family mycothiol-dependent enzyme [Rhodococcus sp. IEGM 1408]|uniref:maleylpyruvate isomerase family mycothiol-dependent enzyme n=1 Tax=Rhodococcus sp. IEGM 1408 TaxID=3082220 RepID=UPI0029532475|nr:maleylpyruvate isomerase family mycothiol-dependent enzyme [Rhodococcus sp. IEGM 1408]MDV8001536.1 maleylpyruvate isomerase family mycothiol-dependent enzyme [Rhodococcus sp. IEGM 1408]